MKIQDVILQSLLSVGFKQSDILEYPKYYKTYSPITPDKNTMSAAIFKDDGTLKIYNGALEIDLNERFNKKQKITVTTLTLTQWLRQIDCMKYYIQHIIFKHQIDKNIIPYYQQYINNKLLKIPIMNNYIYENLRKKLYSNYILDIDMLNINTYDELVYTPLPKTSTSQIQKINTSAVVAVDATEYEKSLVQQYIDSRGLKLSINENNCLSNVKATTLVTNDIYRKPTLEFVYDCGYRKFRVIFESNKRQRFRSMGKYQDFFTVRRNNTRTLYVVEGEIEALSIAPFIEDDIVAIHNTNSLPALYKQTFINYDKVVVKIDKDRYLDNKKVFLDKHHNISVEYKVDHPTHDYNDLLKLNQLSKEVIQQVNII